MAKRPEVTDLSPLSANMNRDGRRIGCYGTQSYSGWETIKLSLTDEIKSLLVIWAAVKSDSFPLQISDSANGNVQSFHLHAVFIKIS